MTIPVIARPLLATAVALSLLEATRARRPGEDIFAKSRAAYVALRSYADTGVLEIESGSARAPIRDRHTFTTYYRAPRLFRFDFVKADDVDRYVVWSDADNFHLWWRATGVQSTYPKGTGTSAFVNSGYPTRGSNAVIASLLFPNAGLVSVLAEFDDISDDGTESVGGRPCHRLTGTAHDTYAASGKNVNVRKVVVDIDEQTLLVRRVVEEWPALAGEVSRQTITLRPYANPSIDDARFKFTPPVARQ